MKIRPNAVIRQSCGRMHVAQFENAVLRDLRTGGLADWMDDDANPNVMKRKARGRFYGNWTFRFCSGPSLSRFVCYGPEEPPVRQPDLKNW